MIELPELALPELPVLDLELPNLELVIEPLQLDMTWGVVALVLAK